MLDKMSEIENFPDYQDCSSVNIFATFEKLKIIEREKRFLTRFNCVHIMKLIWIDHVFETWIRLQRNIFKKADCPSNGLKWKICSFTEETSQMTEMSMAIKRVLSYNHLT
jgi:hypothetical protein